MGSILGQKFHSRDELELLLVSVGRSKSSTFVVFANRFLCDRSGVGIF